MTIARRLAAPFLAMRRIGLDVFPVAAFEDALARIHVFGSLYLAGVVLVENG